MRLTKNQLRLVKKISGNYAIKMEEAVCFDFPASMVDGLIRKGAINSSNQGRLYVCTQTKIEFSKSLY